MVVPDALLYAGEADEVLTGQETRVLQLGQAHGTELSVPGETDGNPSRYRCVDLRSSRPIGTAELIVTLFPVV